MSLRIEDYALIGDMHTAALVGRDGSIDWLCVPRFDSPACFAAVLGGSKYGRWLIAPRGRVKTTRRSYRRDTLILETIFETEGGEVALIDFMPVKEQTGEMDLIRLVEGRNGSVSMQMELVLRFDYGESIPSVRYTADGIRAIVGPDAVLISTPVETRGEGLKTVADFEVRKGESLPFVLTRYDSHLPPPQVRDPQRLLNENERFWKRWVSGCTYDGPFRKQVVRSLITLKALIYRPTAAIIAAPTTSLPECLGGHLNWDYRYCWLRDGTFAVTALLASGYREEAIAWCAWLMRAVGGDGRQLQIMYGLAGERHLKEFELPHLPGYGASRPVRIGNSAFEQLQLDVYGEILNAFHAAHRDGIEIDEDTWRMQCQFLSFLESAWKKPDNGFWEVRSSPRHFTESKVAAWVAFDRAVKLIEKHGFKGPVEEWRRVRDRIHTDVCEHGFDKRRKTFVQYYGSNELDAALLRLPLVGFLPAHDPRIVGTIEAIQHELTEDGLVKRYRQGFDSSNEGKFLACSFWLVDCLVAMNRAEEARQLFERLLGLSNDVGLLSEEYDDSNHRMLGNFPQALTHIALISSALNLSAN
jgi:GH15 family glucan-1,4-alpha-glucosidase